MCVCVCVFDLSQLAGAVIALPSMAISRAAFVLELIMCGFLYKISTSALVLLHRSSLWSGSACGALWGLYVNLHSLGPVSSLVTYVCISCGVWHLGLGLRKWFPNCGSCVPGELEPGHPCGMERSAQVGARAQALGVELRAGAHAVAQAGSECCICKEPITALDSWPTHVVCSAKAHVICAECLEPFAQQQLGLREKVRDHARGGCPLACPCFPPAAGGCAGSFDEQNLARLLSPSTYARHSVLKRAAVQAEADAKVNHELAKMARNLERLAPGIGQEVITRQLRNAMPGARQCGRCGLGPVLHSGCDNLRTHHGERGIRNACQACGWFAPDISAWPRWDGKVPAAATATSEGGGGGDGHSGQSHYQRPVDAAVASSSRAADDEGNARVRQIVHFSQMIRRALRER